MRAINFSVDIKLATLGLCFALTGLMSSAFAADLAPGAYRYWKLPAETSQSAIPNGKPHGVFCVTAANASQPLLLVGTRVEDSDCTATRPSATSSSTETFNMSCSQGKMNAVVTVTKTPAKFVSNISWSAEQANRKSVVVGIQSGPCTK
jgi:hypothetical protein